MALKDRIQEIVDAGFSRAALAKAAKKTNAAVTHWLNGSSAEIKADSAAGIQALTGFSAVWVATGKLPKKVEDKNNANVDAARLHAGEVPVISWVQAGAWHEASDPFLPGEADRYISVPRGHSTASFALRVRGDSMTAPYGKSYPEGSFIVVDPAKLTPSNGDRIIAKLEGSDEVTFKVFKSEDGRQWLAPLNPGHQPIHEPFKVLGTVIGKWEDE